MNGQVVVGTCRKFQQNSLVLGMEYLYNILVHLHPAVDGLLHVLVAELRDVASGKRHVVVQSDRVKLLFGGSEICFGQAPDLQRLVHQKLITLFQLGKAPPGFPRYPLIHTQSAFGKAVLHGLLVGKRAVVVLGVVCSQGEVRDTVQPYFVNLLVVLAQLRAPCGR